MAFVVAALSTPAARRAVTAVLSAEGHTVALFEAGTSAVAEALAGSPDVVIVDGTLPDLSAAQVRRALAAQPVTAAIPVVVCGPAEAATAGVGDGPPPWTALDRAELRAAVAGVLDGQPVAPVTGLAGDRPQGDAGSARPDQPARTVLLVEDDESIAHPLIDGLARYGFDVHWVATGAAALSAPPAALVLLDLGLPDIDGLEVCRQLHRIGDVPVIMLTARGDECDRVVGLELGADDYLAKPFSLRELVARMRAVRRRARPVPCAGMTVA